MDSKTAIKRKESLRLCLADGLRSYATIHRWCRGLREQARNQN